MLTVNDVRVMCCRPSQHLFWRLSPAWCTCTSRRYVSVYVAYNSFRGMFSVQGDTHTRGGKHGGFHFLVFIIMCVSPHLSPLRRVP